MSYATDKAAVTTLLETTHSYKEIVQVLELEDAYEMPNKSYLLKPEGMFVEMMANGGQISTHKIRLELGYLSINTTTRDSNYALFETLVLAIADLASFQNFVEQPTFKDFGENRTKGTINFYLGLRGS